jgi:hypothetical protein
MPGESTNRQTVKTYLDAAHEALAGSQYNLDGGYYAIAVFFTYIVTLTLDRHRSRRRGGNV